MQVISNTRGTKNLKLKFMFGYTFCVCIFLSFPLDPSRAAEPLSNISWQSYDIHLNQALEIPVPDTVNSVVLASPDIADILLQSGQSLFVTGKKIGITNLFLRDRAQITIMEVRLNVVPEDKGAISVFGGQTRNDYSCSDSCRKISSSADGVNSTASSPSPTQAPR